MSANSTTQLNLPNALTILRILLVPVMAVVWFLHPHEVPWRIAVAVIFVVASLTDLLDGYIARKYDLITDFGALWDPIADKLLTGTAFVGLSLLGELPWWMTIVILVREWGITAVRAAVKKYGVISANRGGKAKTLTQTLALILFLLWLPELPGPVQVIGWALMWLAVILTVVTAVSYLTAAWRLWRSGKQAEKSAASDEGPVADDSPAATDD
ncbi:MAG: CDP-diacylglycerol--glycerol-3-phosphate 3-phosphatidyltransferase [Arachnia propionica]|nr:MAG: CDP-diacylglycerol--glycerol-3-phosphate 3-phosphatidyltransferase [Arachnia propionica]